MTRILARISGRIGLMMVTTALLCGCAEKAASRLTPCSQTLHRYIARSRGVSLRSGEKKTGRSVTATSLTVALSKNGRSSGPRIMIVAPPQISR